MSETYRTTDLSAAAFVILSGHRLLKVEPVSGSSKHHFHFPSAARETSEHYYRGAQVVARAFAKALRDLKALIRNQDGSQ